MLGEAGEDLQRTSTLIHALQEQAFRDLQQFDIKQLANLCWGLATYGKANRHLLSSVEVTIAERAHSFDWKAIDLDLPKLACSYARLGVRCDALMYVIEDSVTRKLSKLNPWGLCALTWSFAELYPNKCNGFDGVWQNRGIIKGTQLRWANTGNIAHLEVTSGIACSLEWGGESFEAQLEACGDRLKWSDDDVWLRVPPKFVQLQGVLTSEVRRRGLSAKVDQSPLGPDRWVS